MRFFDFLRAEPDEHSVFNQPETQTIADCAEAKAARGVCKVLSNGGNAYTYREHKALRCMVGNNQADYLFSRFGSKFGWTNLAQAQRFYEDNKGTKGGYY